MSSFDDVSVADLLARKTLKWGRHGAQVIGAWVAEMDYALAPEIQAALHDAVELGAAGYPLRDISTGLPAACSNWLRTTFGWSVPDERIFLLPDVIAGIRLGILAYGRPTAPVVLPTPAYPPFFEVIAACQRHVVEVPMTTGDTPALDIAGIDSALAAGAGTVLLCSPHNPLGRVFTGPELLELSEVVTARGARVIADEVHAPLVYPGHRHIPYASVSPAAAAHTITLLSASKAWNLAGLKCCQVVLTNEQDVRRWRELPFHARHGASTFGITANIAAYTGGDPWRAELLRYLDGNRQLLLRTLAERLPGIVCRPPEATYLAWLDCRQLGLTDPAGHFLRHAGVALSDGAAFGTTGHGFVRLNFATSQEILVRMLTSLAATLRS
jgi:cystathionine beta-lyase